MDLTTIDHLLTTTRSVRKRLDLSRPVAREVIEECLEIAIQAPSGTNQQKWHFVIVTDPDKRAAIGEHYKRAFYTALERPGSALKHPANKEIEKVADSSRYLAENMGHVPMMILPCYEGRIADAPLAAVAALFGSILPATWSLMLALRSREIGAAWTTLHLLYEKEVAAILQIPDHVTQAALLPVAYYTGEDFKPARRAPARDVTYWNEWEDHDSD